MCSTWYLHREHLHVGGIRLPVSGNNGLDTVRRTATRRRRREGSCYNEIHCCKTPPFAIYHAHLQKYLSPNCRWQEQSKAWLMILKVFLGWGTEQVSGTVVRHLWSHFSIGQSLASDEISPYWIPTGHKTVSNSNVKVCRSCDGAWYWVGRYTVQFVCLYLLQLLLLSFLFCTRSWLLQTQKFSPVCWEPRTIKAFPSQSLELNIILSCSLHLVPKILFSAIPVLSASFFLRPLQT